MGLGETVGHPDDPSSITIMGLEMPSDSPHYCVALVAALARGSLPQWMHVVLPSNLNCTKKTQERHGFLPAARWQADVCD